MTARAPAALRIATFAAAAPGPTPYVQDTVARAVLDTVAVAVAARHDPIVAALTAYAGTPGEGCSRIWTGGHAAPERAALVNGAAAHVLDYDDVTSLMRGHPSVALLPGLLALAEAEDTDGTAVAAAYAVGFEVILKLSRAVGQQHYAAGWHSTTAIGGIGATVAAGHLLGLTETGIADAIGLFLGQCAGTRENFGTQAKSFQVGAACAASVRSALLARAGLDAGHGALDGPAGFTVLYGGGMEGVEALHAQLDGLGAGAGELRIAGLDVKKYPLCYATHRALDAVLDLRTEADLGAADVTGIDVRTSGAALVPLVHHRPRTGLEAKFSMEYAISAALLDGHMRLAGFTDAAVNRPQAQDLIPRIRATEADTPLTPRWAEVSLDLTDGRVLRQRTEVLRGSAAAPMSLDELTEKATDCFGHGGAPEAARPFADALRTWTGRTVRDVLAPLPAAPPENQESS
ncbi:MmgE/PrpD family protein [Pseudonocardia sp. MH-G8]|uniref:MmgE/PrpD family protein n=1 Tax=Pseudonocardia sp. MH-G8 TaxID=1854588 RepID=UPI000B9FFE37|nr:MmgE/PrpD family protein [Pseudonocardia sp. MH-G8]OZM76870.1 MmgE/PrpD family protein [Pseudonocardia sp. MH-G8]